ncbi:hypothetical protein PENPOL_c023G06749 [Penicillium polonicum]|uniref:Uncharacterized protein n=1 Tax=Penicillium polonicum TaxID=60169 RepID=A0A1V6N740_PENPO|nr:hypothetical protein PENPOL_c023G06749 [Penicillium polonicum]
MSHGGPGFFYYRWIYKSPWTNPTNGTSGTDDVFHSAVFTPVPRAAHVRQTEWRKNRALPVVEQDVRNYLRNVNCNKEGKKYLEFNQVHVHEEQFGYFDKLPLHDFGSKKRESYGKQI